jgi:hypothetical protein
MSSRRNGRSSTSALTRPSDLKGPITRSRAFSDTTSASRIASAEPSTRYREQFERAAVDFDGLSQRRVIAALLTLPLKRVGLSPEQNALLAQLSAGHQ